MGAHLKDVARYAGVSPATVSRVLNRYPHVQEEVRRRVLEAVAALGYTPDYIARSMRMQTTGMLGFLERDVRNPNFAIICEAAESAARTNGYSLLLCNSGRDSARELEYIHLLMRHRVDGLIAFLADEHVNTLNPVLKNGTPLLLVESRLAEVPADSVTTDGALGTYLATSHLLELGHRSIAILPGRQTILPGRERYQGYLRALQEAGIKPDVRLVRFCEFAEEAGEREMSYLLTLERDRPTAVIAGSNQITNGCLWALVRHGVRLPADLSFVGFDDTATAALFNPSVTVIARSLRLIGEQAVTLLVDRLKGQAPADSQRHVVIPCELIVRGSTAPPKP